MSWRKYLLIPRLALAGLRPARASGPAWDAYWAGIGRTGEGGDVLWDTADEAELAWLVELSRRHLDPALAVVDIGCGNGRQSRALAAHFPAVVGVDAAPAAVERARAETGPGPGPTFRVLDLTTPGAVDALADLAPANVFIRGVLHILTPAERVRLVASLPAVLGDRGVLLLVETAYPGDDLDLLEHYGARSGRLPPHLARLIDAGTPRPSHFGTEELDRYLPSPPWTRLASGPAELRVIGARMPAYHAALRHEPARATS